MVENWSSISLSVYFCYNSFSILQEQTVYKQRKSVNIFFKTIFESQILTSKYFSITKTFWILFKAVLMIDLLEYIFLAKTDLPGTVFPSGLITRGEDPVLAKNRIRSTVPRTQEIFKILLNLYLINIESLLFCFWV